MTSPVLLAAESASTVEIGAFRAAIIGVLLVVGGFFLTVGTVGLLRLPNVYNRMHATSKSATLGAASIGLAGWAFYGPGGDGLLALVTVVFLFLTAPTGAHMISRAAQRMGVEFEAGVSWPGKIGTRPEEPAEGDG
jgi:multicomponent Na+:H+ antiporter subunit G